MFDSRRPDIHTSYPPSCFVCWKFKFENSNLKIQIWPCWFCWSRGGDIMRYHAISCDIICVLRPWFDRHSVTHPAQEIGRYHAISFACSDPGLTGILCADLILLRHLLVEGENAHAELPAIQTSSNPNFQQSKLPAILACYHLCEFFLLVSRGGVWVFSSTDSKFMTTHTL